MVKITININPNENDFYCAYCDTFENFDEYEKYHKDHSPSGYVISYDRLKETLNTILSSWWLISKIFFLSSVGSLGVFVNG